MTPRTSPPRPSTRSLSILGSTGSIGVSTLRLIDELALGDNGPHFRVEVLVGGRNAERLAQQALTYRPDITVLADESQWLSFKAMLAGSGLEIACGNEAVCAAAARPVDIVMAAIVGIAGLKPTWAAAGTGAILALANKESLVCCGRALIERVEAHGGRVLPVDSEHNAIFQALDTTQSAQVAKLTLTASGGPFYGRSRADLAAVSLDQALKHPNWEMGPKITIDSATLANKGLELIEAAYLFDMPGDQIDVVIHPQSVVHSLVTYSDGSSLAQLGPPDMRVPISYCLGWPDRLAWRAPPLDLVALKALTFAAPDTEAFPMLRLAREALAAGQGMTTAYNAANEVCVQAFLNRRIGFLQIADYVETAMMRAQLPSTPSLHHVGRDMPADSVSEALAIDAQVRSLVQEQFIAANKHAESL